MKKLIFAMLVALFILCGCSDEGGNGDGFPEVVVTNNTPLFEFAGKTFDEVKAYFGEPNYIMPVEQAGNTMRYQNETYDMNFDAEYENRDVADSIIVRLQPALPVILISEKCHSKMNCEEAQKALETDGFTCSLDDSDASETRLIAQSEAGKIEIIWSMHDNSGRDLTKQPDAIIIYDDVVMNYYA